MSNYRVLVTEASNGRVCARFIAHDPDDAQHFADGIQAAHPGWHAEVEPVQQPDIPEALRREAA